METLAQLIKLQDYVSRYEWNAYRYPSQFIRLKNENWNKLTALWEEREDLSEAKINVETTEEHRPRWKIWKRNSKPVQDEENIETDFYDLPDTKEELKQYFLDKLLQIQLKWATSTVTDISFVDKRWMEDPEIRYFLQRFPDTYLFMYYPVFNVKKAPVDGEIILITPVGIEIISQIRAEKDAVIIAQNQRTWIMKENDEERKMLSPQIALKRTEQIIKSILNQHEVQLPIQKTVLAKENPIHFLEEPYQTKLIGMHQYESWFRQRRNISSPLKSHQLKTAEILLKHCQTTSVKRPEWEEERDEFEFVSDEF